jgi:RNase P subunit RPR2
MKKNGRTNKEVLSREYITSIKKYSDKIRKAFFEDLKKMLVGG